MKAADVESGVEEVSSLARIVLWPLSCMQMCSPALARPAVELAVGVAVGAFAAAAALSVFGCRR